MLKRKLSWFLIVGLMGLVAGSLVGCSSEQAAPGSGSVAEDSKPKGSASGEDPKEGKNGKKGKIPSPDGKANSAQAAKDILDRMIATYQKAETYRDEAVVHFLLKHAQGEQGDDFKMSVAFQRPNRLRLERTGALIVSDGEKIYGRPEGWGGQVAVVTAPEEIRARDFNNIRTIAPLLQSGIEGNAIQLDLLTAKQPLQDVMEEGGELKLLEAASIDGKACHRVAANAPDGTLTFWIDQESSVLRRVEFPTEAIEQQLAANGIEDVVLTADFENAAIDEPIDGDPFAWVTADDEIQVHTLVQPPDPRLAPNPVLGKAGTELPLAKSDGTKIEADGLRDKVTVIDFWATWCPYCIQGMPKFHKAYEKFADSEDVQFIAVSLDDPQITDQQIKEAMAGTGVDVPWARVTGDNPFGSVRKNFNLQGIPAYVVLDKEGRVQFHHVGGDLDTATEMPKIVEQLLAGKDLAAEAAARWEEVQADFRKQIEASKGVAALDEVTLPDEPDKPAEEQVIEIPRAEIKEKSEPATFKLTQLWKNAEVKSPGNLLIVPAEDADPRVLVLEEFRAVAELNSSGEVVARHADLLPDAAAATYLRTATGKDGKRIFVAAALGQNRFYVFDDQWKLQLAYPEAGKAQIYDVLPVDLDGDGEIELCIGYFGEVGVHDVSLDGQRKWRNRSLMNVADLALYTGQEQDARRLLCTHAFGSVAQIDSSGGALSPIEVPEMAITHIETADLDGDGQSDMGGIAVDLKGNRLAVGLNAQGPVWRHALPRGEHKEPIEAMTAARFPGDNPGHWVVAAADGSLHIFSHDGQQVDSFNTGEELTGLAATQFGDKSVLLTSSAQGVTAWSVEKKE